MTERRKKNGIDNAHTKQEKKKPYLKTTKTTQETLTLDSQFFFSILYIYKYRSDDVATKQYVVPTTLHKSVSCLFYITHIERERETHTHAARIQSRQL